MRRSRLTGATATVTAAAIALLTPVPSQAAGTGSLPFSATTSVGVHNAYEKATFPWFADALDSGAGMLELDVWTNFFGSGWRVAHDNPLWNDNNCAGAATPNGLRSGTRNKDLAGCLADLRAWHDTNPGHRPVLLKIEMKDGFSANLGRGPAQFDALAGDILGDALYRPGDLAGVHGTLDDAVRADGWRTRDALAGKFLIHLIPGTVEENNPLDRLWTDEEYGRHLRDLAAAGELDRAAAFPAVHHAEPGDPRTGRWADASIRPWFVVFDGDASAYASGIDTSWYAERNYLLVMTSAHQVSPAIDARRPTEEQALGRVAELAAHNAGVVSSDWAALPTVLATVLPHG